jgi:putative transcriptional regulator
MHYGLTMAKATSLLGKLLVAMPGIHDANFERSLVFVCAHSKHGAMGLIINKPAPLMSFADLVDKIDIGPAHEIPAEILRVPVRLGGPVEQYRGFVLHSTDYKTAEFSLKVSSTYVLTATTDVLRDIALRKGPARSLITLGYSGWSPGQLENEIQRNGWLHCEADADLVFSDNLERKYGQALEKIGVDPAMLSSDFGHA